MIGEIDMFGLHATPTLPAIEPWVGLGCAGSALFTFVIVYFAAKWGTQSALEAHLLKGAESELREKVSKDQVERALFDLLIAREVNSFVIVQRVLGPEFVQFVYEGVKGRELIIEMPVPTGDVAMAKRAEAVFARMAGWVEGGKHRAVAGLSIERIAKLPREILMEVYGLPEGAQLAVTRG